MGDNAKKCWNGFSRCCLFKHDLEKINHPFSNFPFIKYVQKEDLMLENGIDSWDHRTLFEIFTRRILDNPIATHKALPHYVLWGVWLSRNTMLFQDKSMSISEVSHSNNLTY